MAWGLVIWITGAPIAYCMDRDPTGTRKDHLIDAAVWPAYAVMLSVLGIAWATGKVYTAFRPIED